MLMFTVRLCLQCVEGGLISPTNCVYYTEWLDDRGNGNNTSEEPSRRGSIVEGAEGQQLTGQKRRASSLAENLAW
jgi:hypothetical protein